MRLLPVSEVVKHIIVLFLLDRRSLKIWPLALILLMTGIV